MDPENISSTEQVPEGRPLTSSEEESKAGISGDHGEADNLNVKSAEVQPKRGRSDSGTKPAKRPLSDSEAHIIQSGELWAEKDGNYVFDKTKIIIQQGDCLFMAITDKKLPELRGLDLETLERTPIPREDFCPKYKDGLTCISAPVPEGRYVKRPGLMAWDPTKDNRSIAALVLQEAAVCEILRKHPHPNIAQYHGCLVDDGRITGLCFAEYRLGLQETLEERKDITEPDKLVYSKAIEDGIRHLHKLELAHNDINPSNVMMNNDVPVIIDFDSARLIGKKLGSKAGTFEWKLEGAEFSEPANDFYGLKKIQEVVFQFKEEKE